MARVVLAMSGGVDSSVAAHLLRAQGHDVIGLFMRHGEPVEAACASGDATRPGGGRLPIVSARLDHKQGCCTASDAADARRVADRLDIPFYALDFQEAFGRIIDYFVAEYTAARTPNPCVMCNNWLKFGKLLDYADGVGAEFVATGHYARLERGADGSPELRRGLDLAKDQSYVLFGIDRAALPRILFPVGGERKPRIRQLARELGLRVADKRDSQEICFVTSGDHAEFVRRRRGEEDTSGEIVTTAGEVVGRHAGIEGFTIGQRKGLGVAFGERRFVVRIEADTRRVVIGPREALARGELTAEGVNWLVDEPAGPFACGVQIRYNSPPVAATAEPLPGNRLRVRLDSPRDGVAPGQAVVCYDGDRVLGGGWIE
jgi:tRNA-specific 2-thiouridylase